MKKYDYNIDKFNFVKEIENLYEISDLDMVHAQWKDAKTYDVLNDVETDQLTIYHKKFYNESKNTKFYDIYEHFVSEVIQPIIGEQILYQKIPTFRVHQPSNLAVATFHRDSDYSHSKHEINFYLPLTKAWGNNTIWTETDRDKRDFRPIEAEVGDVWMWNGANLLHGNKINDTGKSRVSVDFRVLPKSMYKETNAKSITNKTKMTIGEYWECL
tara:strand:- start:2758 stop:3399 length:642 start_codon:yes stop_codon:yes gene_type:complete